MRATQLSNKKSVSVTAAARLHMGFLDPNASLGRKFGSIGVALNEISTRLILSRGSNSEIPDAKQSTRAYQHLKKFRTELHLPDDVSVNVLETIPEHAGLGSGTQMSLAIGAGLNELFGLNLTVRDIARISERGARSGIGIGCFEQGGLIVDGGRADTTLTPPVIARMEVPNQWRFILIFDNSGQGLNGNGEVEAFKSLSAFPEQSAARICHLLLMQGLPALAENNSKDFGNVITEIQQSVGDYFASAQGGRFTSPSVESAVEWLGRHGALALGQSSWGPTGFCLVANVDKAEQLLREVQSYFIDKADLQFKLVSARNKGADIEIRPDNSGVDEVNYNSSLGIGV